MVVSVLTLAADDGQAFCPLDSMNIGIVARSSWVIGLVVCKLIQLQDHKTISTK